MGDLKVHLDNPSDLCAAAVSDVLDNLSLFATVIKPSHCRAHTLGLLITDHATGALDLIVIDVLLSDRSIVSFDLSLSKPGRETRKVMSRNITAIATHVYSTDGQNILESATQPA